MKFLVENETLKNTHNKEVISDENEKLIKTDSDRISFNEKSFENKPYQIFDEINEQKEKLNRHENHKSKNLSFFIQQQKDSPQRALISPQIRFVMFQFLSTTVKPFTDDFLTKNVLELIFKNAIFKESRRTDPKLPREYLFRYGKICNYFVLILSGEATIEVGKEKLEFSTGPFSYFGVDSLLCGFESAEQMFIEDSPFSNLTNSNPNDEIFGMKNFPKSYVPDFSLRVDERCVYLKIDRNLWRNGVIKSRLERNSNHKSLSIGDLRSNKEDKEDSISNTNNESLIRSLSQSTAEKPRSFSIASEILQNTPRITEKIEMCDRKSLDGLRESYVTESPLAESETEPFLMNKKISQSFKRRRK